MFDTLSPVHLFWPLLAVCLAGLALLYAAVRDAGRGARRRGLLRRVDALGAPADHAAVDALKEAMAQARTSLRQAPRTAAYSSARPARQTASSGQKRCTGDSVSNMVGKGEVNAPRFRGR